MTDILCTSMWITYDTLSSATKHTHTRTYFQVETRHNRKSLHSQLLGGLLVTMATAAFDLGAAS